MVVGTTAISSQQLLLLLKQRLASIVNLLVQQRAVAIVDGRTGTVHAAWTVDVAAAGTFVARTAVVVVVVVAVVVTAVALCGYWPTATRDPVGSLLLWLLHLAPVTAGTIATEPYSLEHTFATERHSQSQPYWRLTTAGSTSCSTHHHHQQQQYRWPHACWNVRFVLALARREDEREKKGWRACSTGEPLRIVAVAAALLLLLYEAALEREQQRELDECCRERLAVVGRP